MALLSKIVKASSVLTVSFLLLNRQMQPFAFTSVIPSQRTSKSIAQHQQQQHLIPIHSSSFSTVSRSTISLQSNTNENANGGDDNVNTGIDTDEDPRLYRIRLPRATGIEWGTDLSFSFVYVRAMEPSGPASLSGLVGVNDQICEFRAVVDDDDGTESSEPINLIGAPFDGVMNTFASLGKNVKVVDLVFFRGSKEELISLCTAGNDGAKSNDDDGKITITVVQNKGSKEETVRKIIAEKGANIRQTLVDEGINVYQSVTRWTNCKGKQLCGTCIVNVTDGGVNTNRKSMDEESTLRENPDGYRLSCVTFAYGDVTVVTFPPIKAAQWTR